jgi:hypothetical protein
MTEKCGPGLCITLINSKRKPDETIGFSSIFVRHQISISVTGCCLAESLQIFSITEWACQHYDHIEISFYKTFAAHSLPNQILILYINLERFAIRFESHDRELRIKCDSNFTKRADLDTIINFLRQVDLFVLQSKRQNLFDHWSMRQQ